MTEADILYENGDYWVAAEKFGTGRLKPKSDGFRVWKSGPTHSTSAFIVGISGQAGLDRAIAETDRLAAKA